MNLPYVQMIAGYDHLDNYNHYVVGHVVKNP